MKLGTQWLDQPIKLRNIDETFNTTSVTLQVGQMVRCGHEEFTKATIRVLGFWIVVRDRGPLCDDG
jgi:hypothetical protein